MPSYVTWKSLNAAGSATTAAPHGRNWVWMSSTNYSCAVVDRCLPRFIGSSSSYQEITHRHKKADHLIGFFVDTSRLTTCSVSSQGSECSPHLYRNLCHSVSYGVTVYWF